jgi:hypothetical protein
LEPLIGLYGLRRDDAYPASIATFQLSPATVVQAQAFTMEHLCGYTVKMTGFNSGKPVDGIHQCRLIASKRYIN